MCGYRNFGTTIASAEGVAALELLLAATSATASPAQLDLDALVAEGVANQPDVERARRSVEAAREVPSRVGSHPDPVLGASLQNVPIDNLGLDNSPMTGVVVGLTQRLPFPGKLSRRETVAERGVDVEARRLELLEARIAERIRFGYWDLFFAERSASITERSAKILDTLADVANARLSVGQAAQQDALQAQVAHSTVRTQLVERRQAVVSARRALNAAVGRPPEASLPPIALDRPIFRAPVRGPLVKKAEGQSPLNRLTNAQLTMVEANLSAAEWDRWPDFALNGSYRIRERVPNDPTNGSDMFTVGLGVTLPVWMHWKQNAAVREQQAGLLAARAAVRSVELDVATGVERVIDVIERLDAELTLYRRELLPQAGQTLDASISDYQVAEVGFVSVLQNWRTLLDLEIAEVRLLSERGKAEARLLTLTGSEEDGNE